mgnify:CR=1 FL=1
MTNLCIKKLQEKNFFKPLEKRPINEAVRQLARARRGILLPKTLRLT